MTFWIWKHFIMEVFIHKEVERNLVNTSLPTTHFSNCCCHCLVAQLCLTPGTAARQGSMSPSILGWVAVSFQRIFLTLGSNLCLVQCRWILYCWSTVGGQTFVNYLSSINLSSIWSICLSLYSSLYSIYLMIHLKVNALACKSSSRIL